MYTRNTKFCARRSTMAARRVSCSLVETLAGLALVIALASADKACSETECPGLLRYYKDLGCTPLYKNQGDCCAERYDCSHLNNLPQDKCIVNGRQYAIGEMLKEEDRNPCDVGCSCRMDYKNASVSFVCAVVDCFHGPASPGCYFIHDPAHCCPGPEVCPEKPEDVVTCEVDGKNYTHGQYFSPASDPELNCACMPGYTGENVEPFCKKPNRPYCDPLFRQRSAITENCVPVYYSSQSPKTDCNVVFRCQNDKDAVIHNGKASESAPEDEHMTCKFGNLTMRLGDELNQGTDYDSVCVKCVCDVPPYPTCQRLPDNECDVTKHEPFN